MSSEQVFAAFQGLLVKTSLSKREVQELLRLARDPEYWRKLNPGLTVSGDVLRPVPHVAIGNRAHAQTVEQLETDGYFKIDRLFSPVPIRRMRRAIERVRQAGWPVVFATVYDQFWLIPKAPPLVRILEKALGSGYQLIPHIWCHYVDPISGAAGWTPHVDGPGANRISIWVPVSDATIANGCIYLIPDGRIPKHYSERFKFRRRYSREDVTLLFQGTRALPAEAGSVLGWNFGIIHWGSTATDGPDPRISISYEFISRDATPDPEELPLIDLKSGIPSLEQRLVMIGKALVAYRKFEPRMERYRELGMRLQARGMVQD